jgi:hypothetical protein
MTTTKQKKETRVDALVRFFQNNKFTSVFILMGIIIIALSKVTESGDNILRTLGIIKTYSVNQESGRGKFSSQLCENSWNRMFWMRNVMFSIQRSKNKQEIGYAWQKYVDATEKYNSNLMNYYLGLDEYYPKTNKRQILEDTINPKFSQAALLLNELKCRYDTLQVGNKNLIIKKALNLIDEVNADFYILMDQAPLVKKEN